MHHKRIISALVAAAGLSLGLLSQTMPAASAAPSANATAVTRTSSHAVPNITWHNCSGLGQRTPWVVINEIEFAGPTTQTWCFSNKGTWKFNPGNGFYIANFCAGNNKGSFTYLYKNKPYTFNFGPGTYKSFPNLTYPDSLTITGWSGNNQCLD